MASAYYDPDDAALPSGVLETALLSQRDVSLQVPINFVTVPAVSLTDACFASGSYEDTAARKCFSNLLASQVRRYYVDVYWDASRQIWSLCPVELGSLNSSSPSSSTPEATATSSNGSLSSAQSTSPAALLERRTDARSTYLPIDVRQLTGSSLSGTTQAPSLSSPLSTTTATVAANNSTTSVTDADSEPSTVPGTEETIYSIGPYMCTTTIDLDYLSKVLAGHLAGENNLNATLKYMILNVHAAAPASDPTGAAQAPSESLLPLASNSLSQVVNSSLASYIYTPKTLDDQRADINDTWYSVPAISQPVSEYFTTKKLANGDSSTQDGWPCESFVELERAKRLLVGQGSIDPQMAGYDTTSYDGDTLFTRDQLTSDRQVTVSSSGEVTAGCFFSANDESLSQINSSWAVSASNDTVSASADSNLLFEESNNITSCGITSFLNDTLLNTTADRSPSAYLSFVRSTIWSWDDGQPATHGNTSSSSDDTTLYNCAALNATAGAHGKWRVENCNARHYGACRVASQPYEWRVSETSGAYDRVGAVCPSGSSFDVPRTALENSYLRAAIATWQTELADDDDSDSEDGNDELVWLNFNDLDVAACWVTGSNTTCPYTIKSTSSARVVIVPTVAAVIVFVLAAATIFIKCAGNRTNNKRRRRGDRGWDYEGVPS